MNFVAVCGFGLAFKPFFKSDLSYCGADLDYQEKYWKVFKRNFGSLMSRQNWKDFELILGDEYIKNRMIYNSCKGPILN